MKPWSPEEDALLAELYREHTAGQIAERMGRTTPSVKMRVISLGLKKPAGASNPGRFPRGAPPWNKGKHYAPGGRSHETRFKPGNRPHTWNPVGHERINGEGYRERKLTDTGVTRHDYVPVHILIWREHHGPIPAGHAVVFRNKDKTDIRIENLECISRQELMRRNTVHNYPPELRQVMRLKGAISKRINTRTKKEHAE